jgi:hypothetical protein
VPGHRADLSHDFWRIEESFQGLLGIECGLEREAEGGDEMKMVDLDAEDM